MRVDSAEGLRISQRKRASASVLIGAAITTYHRPGGLDNKHLKHFFLPVLETGVWSEIRALADQLSEEDPLPGLQMNVFSFHLEGSEGGEASSLTSQKGQDSIRESSTLKI